MWKSRRVYPPTIVSGGADIPPSEVAEGPFHPYRWRKVIRPNIMTVLGSRAMELASEIDQIFCKLAMLDASWPD
jgi:hypothetical protein